MELGKQIKKYRSENSLSQEALAERVFVSRQTISNWENDRSYPDVKSLVILSEVFDVSLDQLIKGDVEKMKQQIQEIHETDQKKYGRLSCIFTALLLAVMITPVPLAHYLSYVGIGIWLLILDAGVYVSILVEKEKKRLNIQTYKEIVAFMEGKSLEPLAKAKEEGKRGYQKAFLAVAAGGIALMISIFFLWIFGM